MAAMGPELELEIQEGKGLGAWGLVGSGSRAQS